MSDTLVTIRTLKLKMVLRWETARELFMVLAWDQIPVLLSVKWTESNTVGPQLVVELSWCPLQVLNVQQIPVVKKLYNELFNGLLLNGNVY